ncbi:MAG TPA: peptidyl-prolyl cis-trans isomerase, partial [Opitutales bacterium]|nr:peptidyl-prolyl cis-trans isomerase [Opitutales bacterium]
GYVSSYEAEHQIAILETQWDIELAKLSFKDFNPTIPADDTAVEAYYLAHSNDYEVPAQPDLGYLVFDDSQYLSKVATPSDEALHQYFDKHLASFKQGEEQTPAFDAVKQEVLTHYQQSQAHTLAAQAANDFTYVLFEQKIAFNTAAFTEALNAHHLDMQPLPHFDAEHIPTDTVFKRKDLQVAFALDTTVYYSDPISLPNGYGVLIYKDTLAAHIPTLDEVRKTVVADYRVSEKKRLFSEEGPRIQAALIAAMHAGKSFDDAAKELKIETEHFAPFSFENPATQFPMQLLESVPSLSVGEVSAMHTVERNGYWVYLHSKDTPKIDVASETFKVQSERM